MSDLVGFLLQILSGVIANYPSKSRSRDASLGDVIKFCIAFPSAIAGTFALLKIFEYIASHIYIPIDFAIAILLTLIGVFIVVPALFIVLFMLVLWSLESVEKYIKGKLKKRHIRHQFAVVKELIQGRQYQKAQAILSTMSDPKARQWEVKLSRLIPRDPDFLRQLE